MCGIDLAYIAGVKPLVLFQTGGFCVRFIAAIKGTFVDPLWVSQELPIHDHGLDHGLAR